MGIASSVGLISGLETESIITAIMNVERAPITQLQQKQAVFQAKISSYGMVKSALSGMSSSISALTKTDTFEAGHTSASSNKDLLGVSISDSDAVSAGTYKIKVNQLATAAQMTSRSFTENDSTVGAGTLHFQVGDGEKQSVSIDPSATSLSEIAGAINDAGLGVSASVIRVADNDYRLALTANDTGRDISYTFQEEGFTFETTTQAGSTTGETIQSQSFSSDSNALNLTGTLSVNGTDIALTGTETLNDIQASVDALADVTARVIFDAESGTYSLEIENDTAEGRVDLTYSDADGGTGLSNLMDPASSVAAKKALVTINNIDVERDSNTIDDLVEGLTLSLNDEDPAETLTVSVSENYNNAKGQIESFVKAFNSAFDTLDTLQSYNSDSGAAGELLGDSTTNILRSGMRRMIFASVSGVSSDLNALSRLGIEVEETGKLSFDSSVFTAAMKESADDVTTFFTRNESGSKGFAVQFDAFLDGYLDSTDGILAAKIDGYTNSSSKIDDNITAIENRLTTRENTLRSQYAALEQVISTYSSTASYLTSQLSVISNMTSNFYSK
ncbi:flagellar filament capping protein FliD [Desulfatiferula olefinivorans]